MRIGDKSNIESKITKMRCPNPKYALKVLFQKNTSYIFLFYSLQNSAVEKNEWMNEILKKESISS